MSHNQMLFHTRSWDEVEQRQMQALVQYIEDIDPDQLLNTSTETLVDVVTERFSVDVPQLTDERVASQRETKIDISRDPTRLIANRSRPILINGTEVELAITFQGEADVFFVRPSQHSLTFPYAEVRKNQLLITVAGEQLSEDLVKNRLTETINQIEGFLGYLRRDASLLNSRLRNQALNQVKTRKEKILANRKLVESLGYKLKERADGSGSPLPVVKRKVRPSLPVSNAGSFAPEYSLSEDDYEHILKVIQNTSLAIERSPSAFHSMGEEDLRWQFVVQLNGHYEGEATGETFNQEGKTDILIRHQGKNVFIAECKIWKGRAKMIDTIDQLLGYACWRDTKTAILVFCKNKDFTQTLTEMHEAVLQHPNYRRHVRKVSDTAQRYVLTQKNDSQREIILTTLAFQIPAKDQSQASGQ